MNISKLEIGMVVKNYKAMCELLGEGITTGKSKQLQLNNWERFFTYHKEGNKFVIDEVFTTQLEKVENRGGAREGVGKTGEYNPYLLLVVADRLNRNNKENYVGSMSVSDFVIGTKNKGSKKRNIDTGLGVWTEQAFTSYSDKVAELKLLADKYSYKEILADLKIAEYYDTYQDGIYLEAREYTRSALGKLEKQGLLNYSMKREFLVTHFGQLSDEECGDDDWGLDDCVEGLDENEYDYDRVLGLNRVDVDGVRKSLLYGYSYYDCESNAEFRKILAIAEDEVTKETGIDKSQFRNLWKFIQYNNALGKKLNEQYFEPRNMHCASSSTRVRISNVCISGLKKLLIGANIEETKKILVHKLHQRRLKQVIKKFTFIDSIALKVKGIANADELTKTMASEMFCVEPMEASEVNEVIELVTPVTPVTAEDEFMFVNHKTVKINPASRNKTDDDLITSQMDEEERIKYQAYDFISNPIHSKAKEKVKSKIEYWVRVNGKIEQCKKLGSLRVLEQIINIAKEVEGNRW